MCHFFSLFLFFIIFYYFYYFYSIGCIYIIQYTLKNYSYFTLLLYLFALFFYLLVLHLPNLQNSLTDRVDFSLYLFCFYIYFKNKSISNGFFCLFVLFPPAGPRSSSFLHLSVSTLPVSHEGSS